MRIGAQLQVTTVMLLSDGVAPSSHRIMSHLFHTKQDPQGPSQFPRLPFSALMASLPAYHGSRKQMHA